MNLEKLARIARIAKLAFAGAIVALAGGGAHAEVLHTEKSLYRDIYIYEEDGQRCMRFGRFAAARQTCMSVAAPNVLVFDYTQMMMGALYLNPNPKRALVIGLGGGSLPLTLQKLYPAIEIDAVEIDPAVVRVAKKYFGFAESKQMRVTEADGRVFVKRARARGVKYDLIMLDAFDHAYIPEHLLTREFFLELRGLLTERGALAANTFSSSRLYDHESATYHSVFGDFYRLKKGNRVILVRMGGLPDQAELARNADQLEFRLRPFGTGRDSLLPLFQIERGWPATTRVLTDQYSPSNLLNAR